MNGILSRYRLRNTLIASALALVGALLVFVYVASYRKNVQNGAGLATVFVAARDIPAGTDGASAAGGGYLHRESVLRRNVINGAISNPDQISQLAAGETILAGEQITVRQFHPLIQQGVLANISGTLRAMSIPGDSNQLLVGIVKEGDHVAARVVLRNLLVLRAPTASGGGLGNSSSDKSITLALSDSQAQKLLFAAKNGDLWLALRPVAKPADSPDSVETLESILGDGLGPSQIGQLTGGLGQGSINSGN
jgi:pilus assembly protein CpaB